MALYYRLGTPADRPIHAQKSWQWKTSSVQIKNIKLQIVTDIKVNFNSMFGFRISIFGWGDGTFTYKRKLLRDSCVSPIHIVSVR